MPERTVSRTTGELHFLPDFLEEWRPEINRLLGRAVDRLEAGELLDGAMRHALLSGGKRLRPALVLLAGRALDSGTDLTPLADAACALEIIHTFTLVHDDLPAMDDAATRRGAPTLHEMHDSATAILAGDALFNLAYLHLAGALQRHGLSDRLAHCQPPVARAVHRVVEGQILDLQLSGTEVDRAQVEELHRLKTAALIVAAVELGSRLAGAGEELRKTLAAYGEQLGLAYQARDDVIGEVGEEDVAGKSLTDREQEKPTLVRAVGVDRAQEIAEDRMENALERTERLPGDTRGLCELARLAVSRNH